jgi:hypothetical protein
MNRPIAFSVAAMAAATLLLESTLIRLLAVAQFYHFAFLVVSLALLGFGASGTLLSISSRLREVPTPRLLALCGLGFTISTALAYGTVNYLPFDSYSIAWDRQQILYFGLYYLSLTLPCLCGGLGIGAALASEPEHNHIIYAANLLGSAIGVLLAPLAFWLAGVPGALLLSGLIGILLIFNLQAVFYRCVAGISLLVCCSSFSLLSFENLHGHGVLGLNISPYKGLAYAHRYPGSTILYSRWNAFSYVEVLSDAGTRALPGLSYMFPALPPDQSGLSVDANALLPISLVTPDQFAAAEYMPEALAFNLRPEAHTLVLNSGAGLGILQTLVGGASSVTATTDNPLILQAIFHTYPEFNFFIDPRVRIISETSRVFLRRDHQKYDVIYLPLTDAYHPITSGVYSLVENYSLTVEAFTELLTHLSTDGILVVTRWLQTPPSESLRLIALLDEACQNTTDHVNIEEILVAYRGIQTFTSLIQPDGWSQSELAQVRTFTQEKHFDIVWAPDILLEETNRYNVLPDSIYYNSISSLLSNPDRSAFIHSYPFEITPPRDDHPFFFHFFRWQQTPEVLANLGHRWQPFGGSGYLVLLALLILVVLFSSILIILPLIPYRTTIITKKGGKPLVFTYFTLLGVAYLFIEIPLIQRSILLLGYPTYAFTAVVLSLLFFSSLGSMLVRKSWVPKRIVMALLVLFALLTPIVIKWLGTLALGWPLPLRMLITILGLAPLASTMGLPFPFGLAWIEAHSPALTPWAWAVNGCASVIASVLAAILALSYGFTLVLYLGAAAYGGATLLHAGWMNGSR